MDLASAVVGFLVGVALPILLARWQDRRAKELSRLEGNLSRPELVAHLNGFTGNAASSASLTFVIPSRQGDIAVGLLEGVIWNVGDRAAESVVARIDYPSSVSIPEAFLVETETGLSPGRLSKRETMGHLRSISVYWDHIPPGEPYAFSEEVRLESTLIPFSVDAEAENGRAVSVAGEMQVAWRANLSLSSKEGTWPGVSILIRVVTGASVEEAAQARVAEIVQRHSRDSELDGARGLRLWWNRLMFLQRLELEREPHYFLRAREDSSPSAAAIKRIIPQESEWYALNFARNGLQRRRWLLTPTDPPLVLRKP